MAVKSHNPLTHTIRIGVSSCLVGQEVRFDGGHKRNVFMLNNLSPYFEFVPYCPEVAIGMGVPRPPMRLVQRQDGVHAVGTQDPTLDNTEALRDYAFEVSGQLQAVSGYILKKDSPSCGMERVRVYDSNNVPAKTGSGIYADTLMQCHPDLPFEEEGRLMDPVLRENFIERVFIYYRWQQMIKDGLTPSALVDFHSRHKFNVLAHDEPAYRRLGRLVADAGTEQLASLAGRYIDILMQALKIPATRKRHTNVLMHVMGYLKNSLDGDDKQELLEVLDKYRLGQVPLIVPITLLKHHLRKYPQPYIDQQYYMNPYPEELMLRNSL